MHIKKYVKSVKMSACTTWRMTDTVTRVTHKCGFNFILALKKQSMCAAKTESRMWECVCVCN